MSNRVNQFGARATGESRIIDVTARLASAQKLPLADPSTLGAAVWKCPNVECGLTNPMSKSKCRFCGEGRGDE